MGTRKKIVMSVSDNASNITNALQVQLGWKHFGCFAHTLNLIVTDALDSVQPIINKVKSIVTYFKRSTSSNTKLMKYQNQSGVEIPKKLIQDVATRWNSTFYMVERFVELENAIRATIGIVNDSLNQLTLEEWNILKELCQILKPFEDATKCISGENFISASLVIVLNRGLLNLCEQFSKENLTTTTKNIVVLLEKGIRNRLGNVERSNTLSLCTFLDPRFKMYAFQSLDSAESVKKMSSN